MIKCPQCGEENQVGAIFCRGCGDRLELDKIKPDDLKAGGEATVAKATFTIVRNLIYLTILVLLGLAVVAIFLKPSIPQINGLSEAETKIALRKFKKLRKGPSGSEHTFKLSEVNMLATLILELTEEGKIRAREKRIEAGEAVVFVPDEFYIDFLPPSDIKFVLKSRVYDKVNFFSTLVGTLVGSGNGLNFSLSKAYLGKLPIPFSFAQDPIVEQFKPFLEKNVKFKQEVQSRIERVSLEADKIKIKKLSKKKK